MANKRTTVIPNPLHSGEAVLLSSNAIRVDTRECSPGWITENIFKVYPNSVPVHFLVPGGNVIYLEP